MSLISVIVPVYKVEKYLKRCIESILNQTFTDFDLILVDDGSPDNCPMICDYYQKKDKRVQVIHKKNGGLSEARNYGIDWCFKYSDSEWIMFVDSDDWIHHKTLEILYGAIIQYGVFISVCKYEKTNGENPVLDLEDFNTLLYTAEDFFVKYNINATVAWGKLYKKECFNTIRYPVGKLNEDEFTTYKILFSYNQIAFIDIPLYAYYNNSEGIINSTWSPKKMDGLQARIEQIDFFEQKGLKKARERAIKSLLWSIKGQLESVLELNNKKYTHQLRLLLKKKLRCYKNELQLSILNTPDLYHYAYPKLSKIFWIYKGIKGKVRNIGR